MGETRVEYPEGIGIYNCKMIDFLKNTFRPLKSNASTFRHIYVPYIPKNSNLSRHQLGVFSRFLTFGRSLRVGTACASCH